MANTSTDDDALAFRDGKIRLRFIRKNKKPRGAMSNYKDGEIYWMFPRHAALPWWELVDEIDYPFVPLGSREESSIVLGSLDDMEKPAFLGESGMRIGPSGLKGGFIEPIESPPSQEVVGEDFPEEAPSKAWRKQKLLDFITSKGGVAFMSMTQDQLIQVALNLT